MLFALGESSNRYRYIHLTVWTAMTVLMVVDRLLWNVWPRQSFGFCAPDCGSDFVCDSDEVNALASGLGTSNPDTFAHMALESPSLELP